MPEPDQSRSCPVRPLAAAPAALARERLPASAGFSVAEALLTGQESHADRFHRGVRTILDDGGWNAPTWRIDAAFAVFGSLPLVGVTFDDAYILLDTVNGALAGPFAPTSAACPRALLLAHEAYIPGSPVRLFKGSGCPTAFAAWVPVLPPPGSGPIGARPPIPGRPPVTVTPPWCPAAPCPIVLNPSVPGWTSNPVCALAGGSCWCSLYSQETGPGVLVWRRDTYRCPAPPCPPPTVAGCSYLGTFYWW